MVASQSRKIARVSVSVLALTALPMLLVDCGKLPGANNLPGGGCPADISNAEAIMDANFGLDAQLEGKVKAALAAGANLQALAATIETEVKTACGNLATDLGVTDFEPTEQGPGKGAEAACNAAAKAVADLKAKAQAKVTVNIQEPKCSASMNAMAECAGKCDANVEPGSVKVECEGGEISGSCEGQCKGKCTVEAGADCEGTCGGSCSGICSGEISGKCDGKCEGKCDGKDSKGACAGTCEGKCGGQAEASCNGSCKGSCSASCEMTGKADCKGSCSGGCSVELKEPKCSGEMKPPKVSAECKANCDAQVSGQLSCTPAKVDVRIEASGDLEAAAKLKAALTKNLPALLKVTIGMKGHVESAAAGVKASLEGVKAAVSGGGAAALKLAGCFAASIDAQVKASVQINVSVKASASASGSATAGS